MVDHVKKAGFSALRWLSVIFALGVGGCLVSDAHNRANPKPVLHVQPEAQPEPLSKPYMHSSKSMMIDDDWSEEIVAKLEVKALTDNYKKARLAREETALLMTTALKSVKTARAKLDAALVEDPYMYSSKSAKVTPSKSDKEITALATALGKANKARDEVRINLALLIEAEKHAKAALDAAMGTKPQENKPKIEDPYISSSKSMRIRPRRPVQHQKGPSNK